MISGPRSVTFLFMATNSIFTVWESFALTIKKEIRVGKLFEIFSDFQHWVKQMATSMQGNGVVPGKVWGHGHLIVPFLLLQQPKNSTFVTHRK